MPANIVVLDLTSYNHERVLRFCASWSELKGKKYLVYRPRFSGDTLRKTLPKDATVAYLFGLTPDELVLPMIVFRPRLDTFNIHAWKVLEERLRNHTGGVRIATLMSDLKDTQALFCNRIETLSSYL